jgi:hypothetical protein
LIIPCASTARFAILQKALTSRLSQYIADDLFWSPDLELTTPVQDQAIEQFAKFRNQTLWEKFFRKGYVEQIPSPEHPVTIQTIVICDLLDDSIQHGAVVKRLSELATSIREKSADQSPYNLALVVLGKPLTDMESLQVYFPCFYLSPTGWGGIQTDTNRILQGCQNLIVALSTSEMSRFINTTIGIKSISNGERKIRWISLGASAIIADIGTMRSRFELEVLSQFTERLVPDTLNEAQKKMLDQAVEQKQRGFQNGLLFEDQPKDISHPWSVKAIAMNTGWDIKFSDKEKEPQVLSNKEKREGCYLTYESALAKVLFDKDARWWLDERTSELKILKTDSFLDSLRKRIKFSWDRFVDLFHSVSLPDATGNEAVLSRNYEELLSSLRTNLDENANKQHRHLQDTLSFLIERRGYTGDTPLDTNTQWPTGIQAAQYWAVKITERLFYTPVFLYGTEEVAPAQSGGEEYCRASARDDIAAIETAINKYRRFHRSLLTSLGTILKLIVAYPLATGVLDLFLDWDSTLLAFVSLLIIFFLGMFDFVYWLFKDRGLLISIRSQVNELLAKRALSLIARVIQDTRLKSVADFLRIQTLLAELSVLLVNEHQRISEHIKQDMVRAEQIDEGAIYMLSDYIRALGTRSILVDEQYEWSSLKGEVASVFDDPESSKTILSWKSEAKRSANTDASQNSNGKFEKAEIAFIDQYIHPLLQTQKLASTVLQDLKGLSKYFASQEFKTQELASYILAEKSDDLRNGLKWAWLYQRATPLGGRKENSSLFALISVPDELPLTSKAGRASEYWPQEAQVITSRQMNEIGCIRGIIEWEK